MAKKRNQITKAKIAKLDVDKVGRPILELYENEKYEIHDNTKFRLVDQDEKRRDFLATKGIKFTHEKEKLLLDVGQQIGAAPLTNFIITVSPKFRNLKNFGRLIHFANGFRDKFLDDKIKFKEGYNVGLEFIIELLTYSTKEIIKHGLYRTYVLVQEDTPYLKGKLLLMPTEDTAGQLLNDAKFNMQFSCQHDEYTANVLENQILLYTLKKCQGLTKQQHRKIQIQRLIYQIDYDIETLPYITPDVFTNLQYTRLNQRYEDALKWCEMILKNTGLLNLKKQHIDYVKPFFIPMYDLFQDFVGRLLRNPKYYDLPTKNDWSINKYENREERRETRSNAWWNSDKNKSIKMFPDIIAYTDYSHTNIHSILDAKYVDDFNDAIPSTYLYQLAFYLRHYNRKIGYLILPYDKKHPKEDYKIRSIKQSLEIRVRHIDIEETLEWIFDKSPENTEKIINMLEVKFPISLT